MKLPFNTRLDTHSLKFRLWMYFSLFAILLMAVLWFLQIFFLQHYYRDMKIKEINRVADTIASHIFDDDIIKQVADFSYQKDMYIQIETRGGAILFSPESDYPRTAGKNLEREIKLLRQKVFDSDKGQASYIRELPPVSQETLVYGRILFAEQSTDSNEQSNNAGDRVKTDQIEPILFYIFSPLTPVESTVNILSDQLIRVTILSILIAMALSILISRLLTKPIVSITRSATKLAEGHYDVEFEGGQYSELIRLADTLNYASKELVKSDQLQKDLIANVSHDLRTPLTMVKSYAEMIRDLSGENLEKRNLHLQVIIEEADRLNQLVSDMLVLSKMQSGVSSIEHSQFPLDVVVRHLLQSYRILEEQDGYRLVLLLEGKINLLDGNTNLLDGNADSGESEDRQKWMVIGDEQKLKQVLMNLINNAVQYCGKDQEIQVSLHRDGDTIRCQVTDHGEGIPSEELDQIWSRYYRASTNQSRPTSGSGLGLSIVREILKLHGADYGVESQLGQGSTFWFTLPVAV